MRPKVDKRLYIIYPLADHSTKEPSLKNEIFEVNYPCFKGLTKRHSGNKTRILNFLRFLRLTHKRVRLAFSYLTINFLSFLFFQIDLFQEVSLRIHSYTVEATNQLIAVSWTAPSNHELKWKKYFVNLIAQLFQDSLRAWRYGDRIQLGGGARLSASVQKGSGVQPASCARSAGLLPRGKLSGVWRSQLQSL